MNIETAAGLLLAARETGSLVDTLPEAARPRTAAEAYAIQLAMVERLGDQVAGWKVALSNEYEVLYGALLHSRIVADGAAIPSDDLALIGVEVEVAFRFDKTVPPREAGYSAAEIAEAVTALPGLEILDSRFGDYDGTSVIDRAADFMSNSAFVTGAPRPDWRQIDLSRLEARLTVDGQERARTIGGHAAGDPLRPAVALANTLRHSTGIAAGQIVTTGTYTGLHWVPKTSRVEGSLAGFGEVRCSFGPHSAGLRVR